VVGRSRPLQQGRIIHQCDVLSALDIRMSRSVPSSPWRMQTTTPAAAATPPSNRWF
jgi:hypothetical protein